MLSNSNFNPKPRGKDLECFQKPRWTSSAVDENGNESFVIINELHDYDGIDADVFSIRSCQSNGTILKPAPSPVGFNQMSSRDVIDSLPLPNQKND